MVLHRRERTLGRPALEQACLDGGVVDAEDAPPLHEVVSFTVEGDEPIVPLVAPLDMPRSPQAVAGLVATLVVLPLDGVLGRGAAAHVVDEDGEVHPCLAERDAAAAIILVRRVVGVRAALLDVAPDPVFRNVLPPSCVAVAKVSCLSNTPSTTTARLHLARLQALGAHLSSLPAVTLAQPPRLGMPHQQLLHGQLSEALAA